MQRSTWVLHFRLGVLEDLHCVITEYAGASHKYGIC
jgi:hypothetical protein